MSLRENLEKTQESFINPDCTLVAVSKTKPIELLEEAYEAGVRDFGENKVQELQWKQPKMPNDVRWHMIGHLQRNKVKYIAPYVALIHGVDSGRLLKEINKQGEKVNRKIPVLLQIHIAEEESKFGFDKEEVLELLNSEMFSSLKNVEVKGLMGMATNTDDEAQIRKEFRGLKNLFEEIKSMDSPLLSNFTELSMGMSGDYKIAQEEGSTMVRIGSAIFGPRNYPNKE
ncbi:YggS family pyridoxal phosphate-dependent enzyme [Algoriphagus sediminis]|uniref:Pyridoxal phosphate homeostasis protein n=1 Tax=Algoriphagus sediminis TaxID=3057113 RepID=A0ABT7YBC1_9BACT|nr:YggS family pyridoxal phosphate-dependent enzyme [Algoriphagus sediminis]MDN3203489.1 YggS family pyridoxal phosphate-dependent enzyme [Algoriphagus sediminis]